MLKENLFLLEKHQFILDYHKTHLEDILSVEKYLGLFLPEDSVDLMLKALNHFALMICNQIKEVKIELMEINKQLKKKELTLFTPEYLQKNKLMIWKDKYNLLKIKLTKVEKTWLSMKLSQILALELILTKKEQTFYWSTHCLEQSVKLSSLTEIDYQDLDLIYSKPLLLNQEVNSQCLMIHKLNLLSKNSQKTCSQSFISSHVNKWESEVTKTENVTIKTLRFQIHPNNEQVQLICDYANAFKFVYNKTINRLKNESYNSNISKINLRDELVTEKTRKYSKLWNKCNSLKTKLNLLITNFKKNKQKKIKDVANYIINLKKYDNIQIQYKTLKTFLNEKKQELHEFEKKVSKELRTIAVNEAFTSWKTNASLVLKNKKKYFTMKYKTKKKFKKTFTFGITPQMFKIVNNNLLFTDNKLSNKIIKIGNKSKKSLHKINCLKQAEILYKNNKYYLHLYVCLKNANINSKKINNCIGLDPGSATFLSGFSTSDIVKYQQSDILYKLNKKIDRLKSDRIKKYTKSGNKKSKRRVLKRIEVYKSNIIDNLHWNVIKDLCKNYEIICLEKISTKNCVESKLSKITKRNLNDMKHFQFRQRLLYKANNQGIEVILVNPFLTSKYCSNCGNIKDKLKLTDRVYECDNCEVKICRDINACKNILMLGLSLKKY